MKKLAILVNYKDRPSELALLMQSLRTQTFQDWDLFILDDQSGTPLNTYHFFNCMVTRLRCENHRVNLKTTEFPHGVSKARQRIVDWAKGYEFFLRVDDDVILDSDFIERLFKVIDKGYDLASGVTAPMVQPSFIRDPKFLKIANKVVLDKEGNYLFNGDDCGMEYTDSIIVDAHHFRSSALYKSKVHEKVNYTPTKLSKHGFREEQIFSYKLLMNGFKIGVDTKAMAWHQITPSGGERFPDQNELVLFNENILKEFTKENKDELRKLFPDEDLGLTIMKENNLAT